MKKLMSLYVVPAILLLVLAGCGSGGGDHVSAPAGAVVRLSTRADGSAPTIGGIFVTLNLPAGVSVKVTEDGSGQTADGVVVKSGAADSTNSTVIAKYDRAGGTMNIVIVKSDGFQSGEFAAVTCDLTPATDPVSGDFTTSNFSAFDLAGNEITGLEISHTLELK